MVKTRRLSKSKSETLKTLIIEFLHEIGATPDPNGAPFLLGLYKARLKTPLGNLWFNCDLCFTGKGVDVFCRFEEVAKVKAVVDRDKRFPGDQLPNPYSGKWNFHFYEDEPIEPILAWFRSQVKQVLALKVG